MTSLNVSDFEPLFLDKDEWIKHINELRNTEKLVIQSSNINHTNNSETPVEVTVRLTTIDNNDYVIAVSRDITERLQNEAYKEQKSQLQELLMQIASTYINLAPGNFDDTLNSSLSKIGRFVNADRAYIFEYNFTDSTTTNTHEWCANGIDAEINNLQDVPLSFIHDWPEKHKQGEVIYIENTSILEEPSKSLLESQGIKSCITIPLLWQNGCDGFVGFDQVNKKRAFSKQEIDLLWFFSRMIMLVKIKINDQRRMQHLLNTTTEQYNRLSEYSFITSHNVRSSVANISGLVDLLSNEMEDNELLKHIEKSTHQLDTTLKHINELIDTEFTHRSLAKTSCNVYSTFERVINLNKALISHKNAKIILNIDKNISVKSYQAYLDSILFNIFNNALKFGVTSENNTIHIEAIEQNHIVTIKVTDYGLGLDLNQMRNKLFGMGYQFHQSDSGQGFGLFISKRQIESMNGHIDVISEPNKGSTFIITLNS
jgi:signal transduction histidine kinase